MQTTPTFGAWLKQRRRALDFTKEALAQQVGCSAAMITKIEASQRRPSRQIAERLAAALDVPAAEQAAFVQRARGVAAAPPPLPNYSPAASTLPTPLTPLVGRDAALEQLMQLIQHAPTRLLTLAGPPGVGKTRLGLALAARLEPELPDGARFVALAAVRDTTLLLDVLAHALDLPEQPGTAPLDRLIAALHTRHMLLLLDNFEQIVAAAPQIIALLERCPLLQVLVTSRERLHVRGERVVAVPPLALPPAEATDLDEIGRAPAVALFVDTAEAANVAFHLSAANARAIVTICTRLDGLPLALEIVAARSDMADPAALARWLDERMLLGSVGPRDLPPRHRTLRAALDWSYALLAPAEQQLFRRLGACANGWTLDLAAALDPASARATVQSLAHKNLVQHQLNSTDEAACAMLETVREYAGAQLAAAGEDAATRQRHAAYYLALAEEAVPHLKGAGQEHWLARLAQAHENLLTALAWLLDQRAFEQAGRLAVALRRFWWMRGTLRLGRLWIGRVLAHQVALSASTHANLLIADGLLLTAQGDFAAAVAVLEQALVLARAGDDATLLNYTVHNLGMNLMRLGEFQRAKDYLEEVLQQDREAGEPWEIAISLGALGDLLYMMGEYAQARARYDESLGIYRATGDMYSIALTLNNLGEIARQLDAHAAAQDYLDEALAIARAQSFQRLLPYLLNNLSALALAQHDADHARRCLAEALDLQHAVGDQSELATSLVHAAALALAESQFAQAVQLLGTVAALRTQQQVQLATGEQANFAKLVARARAALPVEAWDAAWDAGQRMSATEAVDLARAM